MIPHATNCQWNTNAISNVTLELESLGLGCRVRNIETDELPECVKILEFVRYTVNGVN